MAEPPDFMTEIRSDDRLRGLVALRRKLAAAIDEKPRPRELVSLARQFHRVTDQIDGLEGVRPVVSAAQRIADRRLLDGR